MRAETHFQSWMIECRLNHSHLSEPLAVVIMSILAFTILYLEQWHCHDSGEVSRGWPGSGRMNECQGNFKILADMFLVVS